MVEENLNWKNLIHGGNDNYYRPLLLSILIVVLGIILPRFGMPLLILGSLSWGFFYIRRFLKKDSKNSVDYLLLFEALLYSFAILEYAIFNEFSAVFLALSILLFSSTYFIDRIFFKEIKIKTNTTDHPPVGAWSIIKDLIHGGNKSYYLPILASLSVIVFISSDRLTTVGISLQALAISVLTVFYILRFEKKSPKTGRDSFKLVIIVAFSLSGLALYSPSEFIRMINTFLLVLLFYTYAFDRIILKIMKTFGIIFNVCALLVSIFFVVFAQIQTDYAKEQKAISVSLAKEATALSERAELEASNARKAEANALMALEELEQCLTSK